MKNSFLIIATLLPLLSFSRDFDYCRVRVRYFSTQGLTNTAFHAGGAQYARDSDQLRNFFYNSTFGILVNANLNSIASPTSGNNQIGWSSLFNNQISTNSSSYVLSPLLFPELVPLYYGVLFLLRSGYSGTGVCEYYRDSSYIGYNVNFPTLVSDVLASTNTVFRQIVISSLSSLESSVNNIHVDLGQFQSDYQNVNFNNLNFFDFLDGLSQSGDLDSSYVHHVKDTYNGFISNGDSSSAAAFKSSVLAKLNNDSRLYDYSQWLNNHPRSFNDFGRSFGDALGAGGAHHYTTPLTNELQKLNTNWVAQTKAALSNNTQQIKNQLDSMFGNPADSSTVGGGIANISRSAGALAGTVNNNRVMVTVENATPVSVHLDGPINIDQSQFTQLSTPLAGLERRVDTWYQDWYSFFSPNVSGYNWIQFFDKVSSFKDDNHSDLVSIESCVSNLLVSFSSYTNGLPFAISNAIAGLSLSSTNSYLLLSDYADYIHSGGLDSLLDVMDDDSYIDLKSEIDSLYHADTAEGYGRWWRYFTGLSTVQANSIFKLSNIFQAHEKLLKDLKRDNSDLEVQDVSDSSVFRKLLYTIPSDEDTFSKLSQLTNSVDQSGMVRVQQLVPDLTNRFNVAASLYDKDFVLPAEISWELIPADSSINSPARVVTIRPSEHYRLFQMLHFGLAFSYCLVNIILFPKFLLLLVRLFDRVWNKSEKLIYNSTQS